MTEDVRDIAISIAAQTSAATAELLRFGSEGPHGATVPFAFDLVTQLASALQEVAYIQRDYVTAQARRHAFDALCAEIDLFTMAWVPP